METIAVLDLAPRTNKPPGPVQTDSVGTASFSDYLKKIGLPEDQTRSVQDNGNDPKNQQVRIETKSGEKNESALVQHGDSDPKAKTFREATESHDRKSATVAEGTDRSKVSKTRDSESGKEDPRDLSRSKSLDENLPDDALSAAAQAPEVVKASQQIRSESETKQNPSDRAQIAQTSGEHSVEHSQTAASRSQKGDLQDASGRKMRSNGDAKIGRKGITRGGDRLNGDTGRKTPVGKEPSSSPGEHLTADSSVDEKEQKIQLQDHSRGEKVHDESIALQTAISKEIPGRTATTQTVSPEKGPNKIARGRRSDDSRTDSRRRISSGVKSPASIDAESGHGKSIHEIEVHLQPSQEIDGQVIEELSHGVDQSSVEKFENETSAFLTRFEQSITTPFRRFGGTQNAAQALARRLNGDLGSSIVRQAKIMLKESGNAEIRLIIRPPELGRVRINMQMENGHIAGRILVDNGSVREVLEQNLAALERAFQDAGLEVGDFEVSTGDPRGETANDGDQPNDPGRTARRRGAGILGDSVEPVVVNDHSYRKINLVA